MLHNSSTGAFTPVVNSSLYLNGTGAVGFECDFDTVYSPITIYQWFVNGELVKNGSRYFDYVFTDGSNVVTCQASYDLNLDGCYCHRDIPVTVTCK